MSDELRPPGPDYRETKQIPRVQVPQNTLEAVLSEVRAMRGDVELLVEDGRRTNQRLTRLEERFDELDGRVMRASSRVKNVSESDLSQEARLAETVIWRAAADERLKAIETKTDAQTKTIDLVKKETVAQTAMLAANTAATDDIKKAVTGFLSDPKVKAVGAVVWMLVTGWLATKGVNVK